MWNYKPCHSYFSAFQEQFDKNEWAHIIILLTYTIKQSRKHPKQERNSREYIISSDCGIINEIFTCSSLASAISL